MIELLAPCGNFEKLKTAIHYGADAVYLAGKNFGLRAYSNNFTLDELEEAAKYVHSRGKKIYVTVNIFAKNDDFEELSVYLKQLEDMGIDAIIATDIGVLTLAQEVSPKLELHLSTQANTTNYRSVKFFKDMGISRVVLARELSIAEIAEIHRQVPNVELEAFVHGAMCISYSGRCLLSNYLNGRDSNRGECVQACRWQYEIHEVSKSDKKLTICEDERGTYILNSKDLNMLAHIDKMIDAGVVSLKIEGRMKSDYYVASVVNAYRRAIDSYLRSGRSEISAVLVSELEKTSHRQYTTAYYLGANDNTVCYDSAQPVQDSVFMAQVLGFDEDRGMAYVEMRNRFKVGDTLEILSPDENFNRHFTVTRMLDENGGEVLDAKLVQQRLYVECPFRLSKYDMLRKA